MAESPAAAVVVARRTPATICPRRRRASVPFAETARGRPSDIILLGFRDLPRRPCRLREESRKFIRCAPGLIWLSQKRRKTPTMRPEC